MFARKASKRTHWLVDTVVKPSPVSWRCVIDSQIAAALKANMLLLYCNAAFFKNAVLALFLPVVSARFSEGSQRREKEEERKKKAMNKGERRMNTKTTAITLNSNLFARCLIKGNHFFSSGRVTRSHSIALSSSSPLPSALFTITIVKARQLIASCQSWSETPRKERTERTV